MHALYLTSLIIQLNKAVDTGSYNKISIDQIHAAIEQKRLLRFIKESCGKDIDLSIQLSSSSNFEEEYEERINRIFTAHAGDESRKWGVRKSGLCLALAWTNEIIQIHFSKSDDQILE